MATTISTTLVMPQLGESITEGTVSLWLKKVGDWVGRYEPLVEVMTEKVTAEVPSPVAGYLREILVQEGQTVPVGTPLAVIEETTGVQPSTEAEERPQQPQAQAAVAEEEEAEAAGERLRATPRVRRLAKEYGIELAQVQGSGPGGRITVEDVERFAAQLKEKEAAPAPVVSVEEETIPVTPIRRAIAEHMVRSVHTSPHAWTMVEVDATPMVRLREARKEAFRRRHGVDLSYVAFVIKAATEALRQYPILNSVWAEDKIILKRDINISMAVDTEAGLMVPVIHNADQKSIAALSLAIHELAEKARAGKLELVDVQGGTFSINNTGVIGSIISQPIIPQPQAAILTMEAIVKRPVVVNGDAIAVRSMMNMCLSFDHRILDGAAVGHFLQSVKRHLEALNPDTPIY